MNDYSYSRRMSEEKIKRVAKTGNFYELSDEELQRLVNIETLKQLKLNKNFITFALFMLFVFFLVVIVTTIHKSGLI